MFNGNYLDIVFTEIECAKNSQQSSFYDSPIVRTHIPADVRIPDARRFWVHFVIIAKGPPALHSTTNEIGEISSMMAKIVVPGKA